MKKATNSQLKGLLYSLVPIQAFAVGVPAINTLLNGFMVGHYFGSSALAAVGFVGPLLYLFQMISWIFANGSQILSGRKLGSGDKNGLLYIFNSTIICAFLCGAIVSVAMFVFCDNILLFLGTSVELIEMTRGYIFGQAIGVIFSILFTVLLSFLQLERAVKTSTVAIIVLLVVNTSFNFLNIYILHWGLFGAALSISLANLFAMMVCIIYVIYKSNTFHFLLYMFDIKIIKEVLYLGIPSATIPICSFFRDRIINQIIFSIGGINAMAGMALAMNFNNGIGVTITQGFSNASNMMVSVLYGERDVESLRMFPKILILSMLPICAIAYMILFIFARPLALMFGAEPNMVSLYVMIIRFSCFWFVTNSLIVTPIAIYQAMGKVKLVSFICILNNLVFPIIIAFVGKFVFGLGFIASFSWISELGVVIIYSIYYYIRRKKLPHSIFNIIDIPSTIAVPSKDRYSATIKKIKDAMDASLNMESFCIKKGISPKIAKLCGLCVEEMAVDCILHGFVKEKKNYYSIELRSFYENNGISFILRNNCPHFDPKEWLALYSDLDSDRSIGLRLVVKCAKEMNYSYALGMNVITIKI